MQSILNELKQHAAKLSGELQRINAAIAALDGAGKRKVMPESAKRAISAAQKARWAKWHAERKGGRA